MPQVMQEREKLETVVVTADQMRQIEERIFAAGMPVAALMEKVAGAIARKIEKLFPVAVYPQVGILVGPGHNGGDALVVARELYLQGYQVRVYRPLPKLKELTAQHASYAQSLGIPFFETIEPLQHCDLIIDGLFGFGLTRPLTGAIATAIVQLNQWQKLVVSIDIPSGLHTDTGEVLGVAVRASHSWCLGLWKLAYFQDQALEYLGQVARIDFGIPPQDVWSIISQPPPIQLVTKSIARQFFTLTPSASDP